MYHYIIYKTINLSNNKYYIGKHKTTNIDDGYLGSGIALKNAIKKHGKETFIKQILFVMETEYDMNIKERELVNEYVIADPLSYNMRLGGVGGFSKEDSAKGNRVVKERGTLQSTEFRQKMSTTLKGKPAHNKGKPAHNKGKPMSESAKSKLRKIVRTDEFKKNVRRGMTNNPNVKGRIKPRFTYTIQCPDGVIITTTHLKNWCKEEGIAGITDEFRMNKRGYTILSKVPFIKI